MTNLYVLLGDTLQEINTIVASTSQEKIIMVWHHKLNHMYERVIILPCMYLTIKKE